MEESYQTGGHHDQCGCEPQVQASRGSVTIFFAPDRRHLINSSDLAEQVELEAFLEEIQPIIARWSEREDYERMMDQAPFESRA